MKQLGYTTALVAGLMVPSSALSKQDIGSVPDAVEGVLSSDGRLLGPEGSKLARDILENFHRSDSFVSPRVINQFRKGGLLFAIGDSGSLNPLVFETGISEEQIIGWRESGITHIYISYVDIKKCQEPVGPDGATPVVAWVVPKGVSFSKTDLGFSYITFSIAQRDTSTSTSGSDDTSQILPSGCSLETTQAGDNL